MPWVQNGVSPARATVHTCSWEMFHISSGLACPVPYKVCTQELSCSSLYRPGDKLVHTPCYIIQWKDQLSLHTGYLEGKPCCSWNSGEFTAMQQDSILLGTFPGCLNYPEEPCQPSRHLFPVPDAASSTQILNICVLSETLPPNHALKSCVHGAVFCKGPKCRRCVIEWEESLPSEDGAQQLKATCWIKSLMLSYIPNAKCTSVYLWTDEWDRQENS